MGVGIDFWLQLAVLLACLFFAAPRGGMTLGMMGGIGLVVFVFGFGLTPGPPRLTSFSRLWPWCARAAPCRLRAVLTACCRLPKNFCAVIRNRSATLLPISAGS